MQRKKSENKTKRVEEPSRNRRHACTRDKRERKEYTKRDETQPQDWRKKKQYRNAIISLCGHTANVKMRIERKEVKRLKWCGNNEKRGTNYDSVSQYKNQNSR